MNKCQQQVKFRYTWAGQAEDYICADHARWMQKVTQAMGYDLQMIPLTEAEKIGKACSQREYGWAIRMMRTNETFC